MIFIDTNIFLRYFEQKESSECDRVEELFHAIISGEVTCFTNTMIISEIIWVLDKYYGWDRQEICDNIDLSIKGFIYRHIFYSTCTMGGFFPVKWLKH